MRTSLPVPCPPGLPRKKSLSAAEQEPRVPLLLLRDMGLCYRLLRHLVPGLPPGRAASRVEILQRAIDYILDLQTELDSCPTADPGEAHRCHGGEPPEPGVQRRPLTGTRSPRGPSQTCS